MFAVRSDDVHGISKSDAVLGEALFNGVKGTLERTRAISPTAGHSAVALGQMFEIAGLNEKAAEAYSKALDHDDRKVAVEALARFVIAKLKLDLRGDALKAAKQLVTVDPKYTVTSVISGETYSSMTLLGEALFLNDRLDDAVNAYHAALKVIPGDPFVSGRLALALLATGQSKEVVGLIPAVAKSPRHADLLNTLQLVKSGMIVGRVDAASAIASVAGFSVGRPFRVDGLRSASMVERSDWA